MQLPMSTDQKLSWCQRNLTNVSDGKMSQLKQLYGTLSAKDSLLLHLGDDVLRFIASSDVGGDGGCILIRKVINCFQDYARSPGQKPCVTFIWDIIWLSASCLRALFLDIYFLRATESTAVFLENVFESAVIFDLSLSQPRVPLRPCWWWVLLWTQGAGTVLNVEWTACWHF